MTSEGPHGPKQHVEWVTPVGKHEVELPWPNEDGPFTLRCHMAVVDGRRMLVGLDIRSFTERQTEDGTTVREPGPQGLVEINHPVLRSLKAGEIAEEARSKLLGLAMMANIEARAEAEGVPLENILDEVRQKMTQTLGPVVEGFRRRAARAGLTSPTTQLRLVADLYEEALHRGGQDARRPAKFVENELKRLGQEVTPGQVRGQIHRARQAGLIAPIGSTNTREEER